MEKLKFDDFKPQEIDFPDLISGGISCQQAAAVMDWLYENNYEQWVANVDLYYHGDFQCTDE